AGLPPGARTVPVLPVTGNPVAVNFTWTPTQPGPFAIVFVATVPLTGAQTLCSITASVLSGCAGSAASYGSGCAVATAGIPLLTPYGCPSSGQSTTIEVSQAQTGGLAVLMFRAAPA